MINLQPLLASGRLRRPRNRNRRIRCRSAPLLFQHRLRAAALPSLPIACQSPAAHPHFANQRLGRGIMFVIRSRNLRFALMLASALAVSIWPAASEAYTPEQQQACSDDAFRLCSADIPDVDRVTACMIRKQDQLTPGCRVYFKSSEAEPAVRAGMPLSLSPAAERKRKP